MREPRLTKYGDDDDDDLQSTEVIVFPRSVYQRCKAQHVFP